VTRGYRPRTMVVPVSVGRVKLICVQALLAVGTGGRSDRGPNSDFIVARGRVRLMDVCWRKIE
jgi:hypothetical protein